MRVTTSGLSWAAGGRTIVDGVSLEVAAGETFGLIGPNGSGKSTLLHLIAGLLPRAGGEVRLDGAPLSSLARREIAQRVALVEQHAETDEALSVRDAVELGRTPWLTAFAPFSAADEETVSQALATVGMLHMAEAAWATLSGGERQRVQIARALAQRPRLLLLDEPTNHLDIHHQLGLLRVVGRLPVTVIVALHDLNQALACDRLAVMERGRLIACGPPEEVLTPARIAQVFRVAAVPLRDPDDHSLQFRFRHLEGPG